ncbi:hypothetical protein PHMEG_00036818, partial [Phytophthora megakarya]
FDDFVGAEFDEFDEEDFDFDDDLGMPSMEEMLFMFDMLFGQPPQTTRHTGGKRRKGKKTGGGVRVNLRQKGGKHQMPRDPPGFPSYVDQELMEMFAHGMMFDGMDSELSDLEDEFKSMASVFAHSGMDFNPSGKKEKRKTKIETGMSDLLKRTEVDSKISTQHSPEAKKEPKPSPTIGSKVCVRGKHAGVVMFTGNVHYAKGEFVGVALSSPAGKNDGSIKGVRYFVCSPSHGLMVRPNEVTLTA